MVLSQEQRTTAKNPLKSLRRACQPLTPPVPLGLGSWYHLSPPTTSPALPVTDLPCPPTAKTAPSRTPGTSLQHPAPSSTALHHSSSQSHSSGDAVLLRASGSAPSALPYWERGLLPLTLAALWTFHSAAPRSQGPRIWPQSFSSPPIPGPSWLLNPQHDLLTPVNLQNLSLWAPSPPHSDTRPSLRH